MESKRINGGSCLDVCFIEISHGASCVCWSGLAQVFFNVFYKTQLLLGLSFHCISLTVDVKNTYTTNLESAAGFCISLTCLLFRGKIPLCFRY
jgi:hypothetical protein